jgi:hydrogenase-4 component D
MATLALASFLLPSIGGVLSLVIPRAWIKGFSQLIAGLAFVCSLVVLIDLAAAGRVSTTVDLVVFAGRIVVFGVTIDKVSAMIGLAVSLVGFLIVVYSTGYLSAANREHPEPDLKRRYYFFLLLFIGSMVGSGVLVYTDRPVVVLRADGGLLLGADRLLR